MQSHQPAAYPFSANPTATFPPQGMPPMMIVGYMPNQVLMSTPEGPKWFIQYSPVYAPCQQNGVVMANPQALQVPLQASQPRTPIVTGSTSMTLPVVDDVKATKSAETLKPNEKLNKGLSPKLAAVEAETDNEFQGRPKRKRKLTEKLRNSAEQQVDNGTSNGSDVDYDPNHSSDSDEPPQKKPKRNNREKAKAPKTEELNAVSGLVKAKPDLSKEANLLLSVMNYQSSHPVHTSIGQRNTVKFTPGLAPPKRAI